MADSQATTILVTTTSFQDTEGPHHEALEKLVSEYNLEIVRARGPLPAADMQKLVEEKKPLCGILGDDELTSDVLAAWSSCGGVGATKYGSGVDSFDLDAARQNGFPIANVIGTNHTTVSEHVFGFFLAAARNIPEANAAIHSGNWLRKGGIEMVNKNMLILGFGRIGKEVAKRAMAFGCSVQAYDPYFNDATAAFVERMNEVYSAEDFQEFPAKMTRADDIMAAAANADFISLNMPLTDETKNLVNKAFLDNCKQDCIIVNTARGLLVDQQAMADAISAGKVRYCTDVIPSEPKPGQPMPNNPLLGLDGAFFTAHVASRVSTSIHRQALGAVKNIEALLSKDYDRGNWVVPPAK